MYESNTNTIYYVIRAISKIIAFYEKIFYFILLIYLTGNTGCIKSSIIGDDILEGDEIFVDFSDVVRITATSIKTILLKYFPIHETPIF